MKRILHPAHLLLAVASIATVLWLYPKSIVRPAGHHLTKEEYLDASYKAVMELTGVDVRGWDVAPQPQFRHYLFLWQQDHAKDPFDFWLKPQWLDISFTNLKEKSVFLVSVASDGKVIGIKHASPTKGRKAVRGIGTKAGTKYDPRKAFQYLAGQYESRFPAKPDPHGSGEFRWRAASSTDDRMRFEITVVTVDDGIAEATLKADPTERLRAEYHLAMQGMGDPKKVVIGTASVLGYSLLIGMVILHWLRKLIDRRAAYTILWICLVPAVLHLPFSLGFVKNSFVTPAIIFASIGGAFTSAAVLSLGMVRARELEWDHWHAFRLLLQRQWKARAIGESIVKGFAWSGILALIPAFIFLSKVFPHSYLDPSDDWMYQFFRFPGTRPFANPFDLSSIFTFGLLLPLISKRFPVRIVSLVIFLPAATAIFFLTLPVATGPIAATVTGIGLTLILIAIYLSNGVLAAFMALKGCFLLWTVSDMFSVMQTPWQGILALSLFALIGIAAYVQAARGIDLEPIDPIAERFLSQREKLKVEFSMAQQAQERLLPGAPPILPGFSVAASCQPARNVGGDLYDYFHFQDGRTGFCVADVSGKGMPAALYMTLTKGLIAAASPQTSGVVELARSVNRHLHVACKRKMFVTGILAALDLPSRVVEFVRAGHNPALLFEAATLRARYLNSPGIGFGLTGPKMFDRGTKSQTITLQPGDTLILYSDGVTEAMNEQLELYGEERFKRALEKSVNGDANFVLSELKKDLEQFTGTEPAHDDVTLLVLQAQ